MQKLFTKAQVLFRYLFKIQCICTYVKLLRQVYNEHGYVKYVHA